MFVIGTNKMISISLRKKCCLTLSRFNVIFSKLLCSDSSVVKVNVPLKIKDFGDDFSSEDKKEFPKCFIKDLFINKFQVKVLEYPQLNYLKQVESLKKQYYLTQQLLESNNENSIACKSYSGNSVNTLRTYQLTGFKLPRTKNGFGFANSEFSFIQEALGSSPSLSKSISENDDLGAHLICTYGNETQKEKYIKKLANGEIVASFAHLESEPFAILDPDIINTTAELSSDKQNYIISGKKNWVYNAKYADLFILSANITANNSDGTKETKPTLFLVNKDTPGVKIQEPIKIIALESLNISDVVFDKVVVPPSSVLGEVQNGGNIVREIFTQGKLNNGAHCLPIMRELIDMAITHCINNDFFKKSKYELEYYKILIGEIVAQVYAVESMTYLLTGRLDKFLNPDLFLESLIVKIFASENLQSVLQKCIKILGQEVISSKSNWKALIRDSQFYAASDITNDHLRLVLAITGVQHALDHEKSKNIIKRKTSNIVFRILKTLYDNHETRNAGPGVLQGYLHCIFYDESKGLEDGVAWLYESTKDLIIAYGENVFDMHWELKILADIVIHVYAETAVLGRASRAYCLGVELAEADRCIAEAIVKKYHYRISKLGRLLKNRRQHPNFDKIDQKLMNFNTYSKVFSVVENLKVRN